MNRYSRNIVAFLIVALFLGAYLYIRHDTLLHEAMIGGTGANVVRHTSEEYEKYFGQAPDVSIAECEGLVIFYPAREGEYIIPYPIFVTSPENREVLIAKTLFSDLPVDSMKDYVRPLFDGKGELESAEVAHDLATLKIRLPGKIEGGDLAIAARLFLMTYAQIDHLVTRVIVDAGEGRRVEDDIRMPSPPGVTVREPGQPVILDAFLVANGESEISREIRILFDRPVAVKALRVENAGGEGVQGKFYLSEFSMAVIFRTEEPLAIEKGKRFTIDYDIHDYRGRKSKGEKTAVARLKQFVEDKRK